MSDAPRKPPTEMVGATGLKQYGGYIREEFLTELTGAQWYRVLNEMQVQDPTISGILFAIQMLIRQVPWSIVPGAADAAGAAAAQLVEQALHDMRESWALTLAEILSFLPWGWAALEVVYKVRGGEVRRPDGAPDLLRSSKFDDGRVGWATWSIRAQDTLLHWTFDDATGEAISFEQIPPPTYIGRTVPLAKCLHFRTSSRKANPEGASMLRGVYRPWYFKKRIENIEGIGIERDLAGIPVAEVPAELLSPERSPAEAAAFNQIQKIVTNIRRDEQEGVVWPLVYDEGGRERYRLRLLTTGGARQFDTSKIIERYDSRIAMSVLADFILMGHQQVGSYSLVSSKTSMFATALGAWLDTICGVINARIPELLRFNGIETDAPPTLAHGDVEKLDLGDLATYLQALNVSAPLFAGADGQRLYRYLLDQAGLPTPTEAQARTVPPPPAGNAGDTVPAQAAEPFSDAEIDALIDEQFAGALALAQEA